MDALLTKVCSECLKEKSVSFFYKKKKGKYGVRGICKECSNKHTSRYREENPDKVKEYLRLSYFKHRSQRKAQVKEYYLKDKNRKIHYQRKYQASRMKTDFDFKMRSLLRSRLSKAVVKEYKRCSAVSDLGCSIQHLKLHLELFWDQGMTWDNYGKKEGQWSIDHIYPLSLAQREDSLKEACHYTNLQPMWNIDNIKKSSILVHGARSFYVF